jgi:hypothetical protein
MKQILERIGSHQMLVALVLILVPLVAWRWVLWREHKYRLQLIEKQKQAAVAWSREMEAIRQTRRGFAVGNPFPKLNVVSETSGNVPVYERSKPVLLWFPLWFEGAAAWKPEQWQGWRELLARCPNLHLVGVVVTPSAYASSVRRDLQQLHRVLQHPRIGFWMIVSDDWANDDTGERNPFIQKQVMLIDGNGIIRYSGLLRRSMPSEAELRRIEEEYQKLYTLR